MPSSCGCRVFRAGIGWRNHGTAVLGEMVSIPNSKGCAGISHQDLLGDCRRHGIGPLPSLVRAMGQV